MQNIKWLPIYILAFIQIGCLGGCGTLPSGWDSVRPEALDSVSLRAAPLFAADSHVPFTDAQLATRVAGNLGASVAVSERAQGIALETRMRDAVRSACEAASVKPAALANICRQALEYADGIVTDAEIILGTIKAARAASK